MAPYDLDTFLQRHALRRVAGVPTVGVLVGPVGSSRRSWLRLMDAAKVPVLECRSDPLAQLRTHLLQRRDELSRAVLRGLARRRGRDPQQMIRDWSPKTRADVDAFWNALAPASGDDLLRGVLSSNEADFPDVASLSRLLDCDLPSFIWPALFAIASTPQMLPPWGDLAQQHPKLALTVAVSADTWTEFTATAPGTRAKTILQEGEIRLPGMELVAVAQALIAGGVPEASARQLAEQGGDEEMIEAAIALAKATAAVPATPEADDEARSKAERALFAYLENLPETAGRFTLNANLDFKFGSKLIEIDLLCTHPRIAIEVDGYFHFRDNVAYRRDREKDWELQKRGYLVIRFLADDVTPAWGVIRDRILEALNGVMK